MTVYTRIGEAIGETLETVCCMKDEERDQLIETLGLGEVIKNIRKKDIKEETEDNRHDNESLNDKISVAIGEPVEAVELMGQSEKDQLIAVLGLEQFKEEEAPSVIDIDDNDSEDDDDSVLVDNGTGQVMNPGWGECPVCGQLMRNTKLQYHAMACQGLHLNGGDGLEVNPMEVQSKCSMCGCLVPDLVMEEHKQSCWGNNSNKRRIETPMERRQAKYPKTNYWASAPRK